MSLEFKVGVDSVASYRRLNYSIWYALAEFVDNSTQSFFDNEEELRRLAGDQGLVVPLHVRVIYDPDNDILRITDNAAGMDLETLTRAFQVGVPPPNATGRCRYGMGMKTSACWLGDEWSIETRPLGSNVVYSVKIDVNELIDGNSTLEITEEEATGGDRPFTILQVSKLRKKFKGRTLGKIKDYLKSFYRMDIQAGVLQLEWRGERLEWVGFDDELLRDVENNIFKQGFDFNTSRGRHVYGWAGIFAEGYGGRPKAGFSILQCNRVVRGWPESWRPTTLYGQLEGTNDLVNQRLVGEIHLDDFPVSHTKDDIVWDDDELDEVEDRLLDELGHYRDQAKVPYKDRAGRPGPKPEDIEVAIAELQEELTSPEFVDKVRLVTVPDSEDLERARQELIKAVLGSGAGRKVQAAVDGIEAVVYFDSDRSGYEPYYIAESTSRSNLCIVINMNHPHIEDMVGASDLNNYFRHCVYDAISEHKARLQSANVDSRTIHHIKDHLLRVKFEMREAESGKQVMEE